MDFIKAVILGIVEGITEFLPISSTGHLIIASALLDFSAVNQDTFVIFIQLGAVVAVVLFYWRDLLTQVTTVRTDPRVQRLWLAIAVAFVPAAAIGVLVRDWVKDVLFKPVPIAIALIVGGIALILIERRRAPQTASAPTSDSIPEITLRQAIVIGVAQSLALIPGVSRSAASIVGGMFSGLTRPNATRFSFYLAIPTLGLATIADLVFSLDELEGDDLVYLLVGAVTAGVVAWFAIRWLLTYVSGRTFIPFGWYRIAVGIVVIVLAAVSVI